ncbi:MAG TPA: glycosyltransferase family 39 protein [Bryobacteraceae bacterium]|nr:glycosyltransferase family 39 protein [Bryobacteraceae bacterium]
MRSLALAAWLIAIAAARILSAWPQIGITYDEPAHLACGIEYLSRHTYRLEPQHPPLARAACAFGPFLAGVRPVDSASMVEDGVAEFYQDGSVRRHLLLDRAGVLPFFVLASVVVYFWALRHFSSVVAVLATAFFTLTPPILAHAGLGTTDMTLNACLGAAFVALIVWAEQPTFRHGVFLGVGAGLAALSKFTALAYFPAAASFSLLAWLGIRFGGRQSKSPPLLIRQRTLSFALAVLVGGFVIWAGYLFSFGPVPEWNISLPAPQFFAGILQVLFHNEAGHVAWFLGSLDSQGWWYFFPVMLAVKTPLGLLVLAAAGLAVVWKHRNSVRYWLPPALIAGTLVPAMLGRIDIGTRHVLPVYLGLSILAALGFESMLRHSVARLAAIVLLVWIVVSGALHYPDSLAYFNELAPRPETITADSDLEWGQDTVLLARRLKKLGATQATCSFWNLDAEHLREWPGLNCRPLLPLQSATGWIAVSPTNWHISQYGLGYRLPGARLWFEDWKPVERLGGLLLYYQPTAPGRAPTTAGPSVPPSSLRRATL